MSDSLLVQLPEHPVGATSDVHWWHVVDGALVQGASSGDWRVLAAQPGRTVVGLAPSTAVRVIVDQADRGSATPRQAAAIARFEALETCLGDRETLHAVSGPVAPDGRITTAVAANSAMLDWIDWARDCGVELDHIRPVSLYLLGREVWTSASVGNDHFFAKGDIVAANDPTIAAALVGSDTVSALEAADEDAIIVRTAEGPGLDLRTGRFAKRRRFSLERGRVRELIILAAIIPVITLLWAIVSIVKLNSATEALNRESVELAASVLGRTVTLETAEAELAQMRGGRSGLTAPLASLYQALQAEAAVTSTQIGYGAGGSLSATLAAPSHNDVNRLLLALQRDGYRVTAVPRQSPDGRTMVDLTMRVGP